MAMANSDWGSLLLSRETKFIWPSPDLNLRPHDRNKHLRHCDTKSFQHEILEINDNVITNIKSIYEQPNVFLFTTNESVFIEIVWVFWNLSRITVISLSSLISKYRYLNNERLNDLLTLNYQYTNDTFNEYWYWCILRDLDISCKQRHPLNKIVEVLYSWIL